MKALKGKKGFTLTEIIVVLVIVAVLAAIAIPALTGYIKNAREKASLGLARNTFSQLNGVLLENDTREGSTCWAIVRWAKENRTTDYKGEKDNSVTLSPPFASHHDTAKHAIRTMMGGKVITFGYRLTLQNDGTAAYRIKKMEVFYVTPSDAAITNAKPDIVFGE